jgi:hypothetical protein
MDRIITTYTSWFHTAATTSLEIQLLGFETLLQAQYSPDLVPMDFALFPLIKSQLRGINSGISLN